MSRAICAVVTAFRPDAGFVERFRAAAQECKAIVVVDNTPGGHDFGVLPSPFILLQDGRNKGLGPALNAGIDRAQELGCEFVALFDQDSRPGTGMISRLADYLPDAPGCIGPTHLDDGRTHDALNALQGTTLRPLQPVAALPTSGMLFALTHWTASTRFSDDLFLDLVDFEWCWRLRSRGWSIVRSPDIHMLHRLGLGEKRFLGVTYHVPAPFRHYFQFRDTLRIAPRSYVPWYPRLRLLGILPLKLLAYPWLLDRGAERLGWMLKGIADAVRGRSGAGAAASTLGV